MPRAGRVLRARRELAGVVTLALAPCEGAAGAWLPGQFNMLSAFGVGEAAISMSGAARDGAVLHTIRAVGPVSAALSRLGRGGLVGVRGPFGCGWDLRSAAGGDVVVVAGGLGLAPLRPAIRHLLSHRSEFGRVTVLIGARSPDQLLYRQEVARWSRRAQVALTVDHAAAAWAGHVGLVTQLVRRACFDAAATTALVCGPEAMMRFTARALADAGIPPARIQVSMERNMRCAVGSCGHCQVGPFFVCRDGPVFTAEVASPLMEVREL